MQFLKRIFVLIFLSGMLFTVFNYVPIIEEEVSSKKQEQTSHSESGDGGGEDDTAKGQEDLFHVSEPSLYQCDIVNSSFGRYLQSIYIPPLPQRNTPPPRQVA